MIQADRIAAILVALEEQGSSSIAGLAERFAVSEETIRRDVRQLEGAGRVLKVHGGVTLPSPRLEAPYRRRLRDQVEAKRAIARLAAAFVEEGSTVFVDSGTTSYWAAQELGHLRGLTLVTNSLEVASEALGRGDHRVFLAGGAMNADYRSAFDADAIGFVRRFVPDVAILSMAAIEAERGFLDLDPAEAAFKRAVLDRARRLVVVADHGKFLRQGTVHVADFGEVHDLVTDRAPPPHIGDAARAGGTALHLVTPAA
ncbi:DeoR/GlpR family DNA-binding transcription regulator [Novosphingobium sp. KA1]|uniref:DeoR/GlpR family DNA-binding transcription regulator n=1 Tax=Novosphingobium sp. (strain KA1) TaxID=164608 RepID=UPI001F5CDF2F|nr:DeoR/GlpR family DNA-binding transcription regulator [Novosphingobium sp. KA1]